MTQEQNKLANKILRKLRADAHHLSPVVMIGAKGLSEAVQDEINLALLAHELIKIKVNGQDKAACKVIANAICEHQQAALIDVIGHVVVIYRKNPEKA